MNEWIGFCVDEDMLAQCGVVRQGYVLGVDAMARAMAERKAWIGYKEYGWLPT